MRQSQLIMEKENSLFQISISVWKENTCTKTSIKLYLPFSKTEKSDFEKIFIVHLTDKDHVQHIFSTCPQISTTRSLPKKFKKENRKTGNPSRGKINAHQHYEDMFYLTTENRLKQNYFFYPCDEQMFKYLTITNTDKM